MGNMAPVRIALSITSNRHRKAILAVVAIFLSGAAHCQSVFLPYASAQYEHNNNVFALPNSAAAVAASGDPQLGDSDLRTVAGFEEDYLFGRQRFYATVEGRYIDYDHFSYLNHSEYLAKLALDWNLTHVIYGTFLGSIEHVMAAFAQQQTTTQLAINTDRNAIAKFNVRLAPEWRLETSATYHDLDSPIQNYPDYGLTETMGHAALKYLGFANLTYGISADYLDGNYRNAPTPGSYTQSVLALTMAYQATGLSSFNMTVGRTRRDEGQDQPNVSEWTGALGYTRQLGGKTTITLTGSRAVNSFIGVGGSELDTAARIDLHYQATFKTGFSVRAQYAWEDFLSQTVPGSDDMGRKDKTPSIAAKINYQPLLWLTIQPYFNYQKRNSNQEANTYSATSIGVQVLAKRPAPPQTSVLPLR
jgi:hypothetical protein